MKLTIDVNIENLARDICNELNNDALFKLIQDIDLGVADWDFTKRLYNYFKRETEKVK